MRAHAMSDSQGAPWSASVGKPRAELEGARPSVAKPRDDATFRVGFYNIGWQDNAIQGSAAERRVRALGQECAKAIEECCLGVLCLCEFGTNRMDEQPLANIGHSEGFKNLAPGKRVEVWLKEVIEKESCKTSWFVDAEVIGPYAVVVARERACFERPCQLHGPLVHMTGTDHSYRMAVCAKVRVTGTDHVAEVWLHHAPSSKKGSTARMLANRPWIFFSGTWERDPSWVAI